MSEKEVIAGGSPFNIVSKSLRIGNFSRDEIKELYTQHTTETSQKFEEECFDTVMEYTDGQPWLVNALANEVTQKMKENRDRSVTITPEMTVVAIENIILKRQTHLRQILHRLEEDRVRRVVLPIITGGESYHEEDDAQYCIDLGIIKGGKGGLRIANKIYQEIIPRSLTVVDQEKFENRFEPEWVKADGSIDDKKLISMFKEFWNKNASIWGSTIAGYHQAAPQLVLQAFLQRVVNGFGYVHREYALGTNRLDLMVEWKYRSCFAGCDGCVKCDRCEAVTQYIVMELKIIGDGQSYNSVREKAITQTVKYAKKCGQPYAHILIFDRDGKQHWDDVLENEYSEHEGVKLEIWKFGAGIMKKLKKEN
jgi:hypothetical protein